MLTNLRAKAALPGLALVALTASGQVVPDAHTLKLDDGQYVDVTGKAVQITGKPITVQAWFRTEGRRGHILESGMENRSPSSGQAGYALYLGRGGAVRFGVNSAVQGYKPELWDNAVTKAVYNDAKWHHASGVFYGDGKTRVKIYVDGEEIPEQGLRRAPGGAAQPALSSYSECSPPSRMGVATGGAAVYRNCFRGEIDELRVWNVALTADQVKANYRTHLPADTPGLMAQWSFAPGPDKLADAANAHRGTIAGVNPPEVLPLDYDYSRYPGGLTGFTGYQRHQVAHWTIKPAVRQRIGKRGLFHAAIAILADDSLVACAATWDKPDEQIQVYRSTDHGASWTKVEATGTLPTGHEPRLLVGDNGSLLLRTENGSVSRSGDGGRTWQAAPKAWPLPETKLPDPCVIQLSGDRMLAAVLATGDTPIPGQPPPRGPPTPAGDRTGEHSVLIGSDDGGKTWAKPRVMLGYSETDAHLLRLQDGRLLCTYANQHVPFGIMAIFSDDEGRSWDTQRPVLLARGWGPAGGWPSSVQLQDGSIATIYTLQAYRGEGLDTAVEVVRWQLPPRNAHPRTLAGISSSVVMDAEPQDRGKYPAGLYGYSGDDRQLVAYIDERPARRATIGHRGLYKGALAKLQDGTLVATPSFNMAVQVYRSRDNAETWEFVCDPDFSGKEMGAAVLRDGTLLNLHGKAVYRSTDGGVSWTTHPIDVDVSFGLVRNVVEHADGSLLMVAGQGTYYDRTAPLSKAYRLMSRDGGRTWPEFAEIPCWKDQEGMFDEAAMIRLRNGNLLAASRITDGHHHGGRLPACGYPSPDGSEDADHMMLIESSDDGFTWSEPRDFLDYSRPHAELLQLKDGRILSCYANYYLPYGVFAVLSEDDGKTWSTDSPIQLSNATGVYAGWPCSVQLDDGSIVTMYATTAYAGRKNQTLAETVRWTLPPASDKR